MSSDGISVDGISAAIVDNVSTLRAVITQLSGRLEKAEAELKTLREKYEPAGK